MEFKIPVFVKKLTISCSTKHTIFPSNSTSMLYKYFKGMYGESLDPQCQHELATVTEKNFNGKFIAKN